MPDHDVSPPARWANDNELCALSNEEDKTLQRGTKEDCNLGKGRNLLPQFPCSAVFFIMKLCGTLAITFLSAAQLLAASGDPQLKTNHPFYPGELSCSTFERLFATQAELYQRVTGRAVTSDEDKALASWYWRNLNYAHGEDGRSDCFNKGFANAEWNREYWTGLFAHGFALCGTTHSQ